MAWSKFVVLAITAFVTLGASAQAIDVTKTGGHVIFLQTPGQNSWEDTTTVSVNPDGFYTIDNLKNLFNLPYTFVLLDVNIKANADGEILVAVPVTYNSQADYNRGRQTSNLTNCLTSGTRTVCLLQYTYLRKTIPTENRGEDLGQVRKIVPTRNMLLMTTTRGKLITYTLSGNLRNLSPNLYLVPTPNQVEHELAYQDLTRFYDSDHAREVLIGINGSFGSKIWSLRNGYYGYSSGDQTRRWFRRHLSSQNVSLLFHVDVPNYYSNRESSFTAQFDPYSWNLGISYLSQPQTLELSLKDLSEVK